MRLNLKKLSTNKYQLEKIPGMKAEGIVYATEKILESIGKDLSLSQLAEAAMLPGVVSPIIGMPDIHEGFGLPIGGVMATEGLISAGAVGMDINCGVRLLKSQIEYSPEKFTREFLWTLVKQLEHLIPIGLGGRRKQSSEKFEIKKACLEGVEYLFKKGFADDQDIQHTEEYGKLKGANFSALSQQAINRASNELGTLGSGNHFIEIQKVIEIFDKSLAEKFGLFKNQICVMIHSGSRALGHQTCTEYTEILWRLREKYGIEVPRKGLAALPLTTKEGQDYFGAMKACVNFAFCNRQVMTYFARIVFERNFGQEGKLELLYDVAHNIAKWEEHQGRKVLVHRKGATRALPANHPQNPQGYMSTGHPAIVPGSMGTASYVMIGLPKNVETFDSINHGAGRLMSRGEAKRTIKKENFEKQMENIVYNKPFHVIADEAPDAYKDITKVIETLVEAGLTKKVVKLSPLAVIKGD